MLQVLTPNFMDATATLPDLRIKANTSVVDQVGANLSATVTDDYDGKTRADYTPYDLGAFAYTNSATASLANHHFKSLASGNWRTNATWQSSADGSTNWITATAFPSATAASITVQNGHNVTVAAEATASNLTVEGGGKLTLNDRVGLSATNLTLNSHATNGTATFVDENTSGSGLTVSGTTTANQYLGTTRNWYVSSPITNAKAKTGFTYYKRSESASSWTSSPFVVGDTFVPGVGYIALPGASGASISFVSETNGKLNHGTVAVTLTKSGTSSIGYNLIGNPYPTNLTWTTAFVDDVVNAALIEPTIYYRTNSGSVNSGGDAAWSFKTYNSHINEASPVGTTNIIPPMQAFWVKAKTAGTLYLDSKLTRSHQASNLLKAPANSNRQRVRLLLSNGVRTDETLLLFDNNAEDGVDAFDSPKFAEANSEAQIFTTIGAEKFVINGMNTMPLNQEIALGFVAGNATSFTLKANEITNLPEGVKVILKDNITKAETDLTDGVTTYQFAPEATSVDRFSLIFRTAGSSTDVQNPIGERAQVYVNAANQITIIAPERSNYSIYNAMGQMIENGTLNSKHETRNANYAAGVYVVKVNNQSTRVIIK